MEPYETEDLGVLGQPENNAPAGEELLPPESPAADPSATPPEEAIPVPDAEPEAPPKKKRASRKKAPEPEPEPSPEAGSELEAEPAEGLPVEPEAALFPDAMADAFAGAADSEDDLTAAALDDALDAPTGDGVIENQDVLVVELSEADVSRLPETSAPGGETEAVPDVGLPAAEPARRAARPRENRPVNYHQPLTRLNLNDLDRKLSRAEREEWNAIYASFRAKSILTGEVIGPESMPFFVRDQATGRLEQRWMNCVAVISYRVKVLIPEAEFWMPGEERPTHVFHNLSGAKVDYVIVDVDRVGDTAIASRRMGAAIRRHAFLQPRAGHEAGERMDCRVLTVGPTRCLVECNGFDQTLTRRDMSYTSIYDLREKYHPGQELECVLTACDRRAGKMEFSVKLAEPDPFDGVEIRHPVGSRRQATITGKYAGGVFCTIPDGTTVLCLYTARHSDRDFHPGDKIMLVLVKHDQDRRLVYGRILSKW